MVRVNSQQGLQTTEALVSEEGETRAGGKGFMERACAGPRYGYYLEKGGREEMFQAERIAYAKVQKQEKVRTPFCLGRRISKGAQNPWGGRSLLGRGVSGDVGSGFPWNLGGPWGWGAGTPQQAGTVLLSHASGDSLGQAASSLSRIFFPL